MKIFITSAGTGSRLEHLTTYKNKAMISLGLKPAISHIIERIPLDLEIILAVGYKAKELKEIVDAAHPDHQITYVDVEKFEGEGSGLGHTFKCAEDLLQEPFIYIPNDTVILDTGFLIDPVVAGNWIGFYDAEHSNFNIDRSHYRCVELRDNAVVNILPKGILTDSIYIGLCGVKDYETFWQGMNNEKALLDGETTGLNGLNDISAIAFPDWIDTGNLESLQSNSQRFDTGDTHILNKIEEAIWIYDDRVIKFHHDSKFIQERIKRLDYLPKALVPEITTVQKNIFVYKKADGKLLSKCKNSSTYLKLLESLQSLLWSNVNDEIQKSKILDAFYREKTLERLELYANRYEKNDKHEIINGIKCEPIHELIKKIKWEKLYEDSIFAHFHGDLHGENILISQKDNFILLDWRQNFGQGNFAHGDVYYDLAKLNHGLLVAHKKVTNDEFSVKHMPDDTLEININLDYTNVLIQETLFQWISDNNYHIDLVKIITALIYINIAPLHHYSYAKFLFYFGKLLINLESKNENSYIN
jgi:choline kinase